MLGSQCNFAGLLPGAFDFYSIFHVTYIVLEKSERSSSGQDSVDNKIIEND